MSETATDLYCDGCGDTVSAVDANGHGKCCRNLPDPWRQSRDGLYNSHTDESEHVCEDRAECVCGGTDWIVTATQAVSTSDCETVWVDSTGFENATVRCADPACNRESPHNWEWC
jgi:hypothetical protein